MRRAIYVWMIALATVAARGFGLSADDPDLVGLWLFDDGKGDQVTDSSKNTNHAKFNGKFDWMDGKFGKGVLSSTGSIDVPTSDSINAISDAVSVAGWFRVDADSDTGIRRQNAFLLEDQSASEPVPHGWSFRIWTSNGLSPGIYGKTQVKQKEWTHIAGVWDGAAMKLYINGAAEKELLTAGAQATDGKWGGKIGKPGDMLQLKYGSETYVGGMDEIVIFKRALSEAEVKALAKGWSAALAVGPKGRLPALWGSLKRRD
jgi:hypothetical protein